MVPGQTSEAQARERFGAPAWLSESAADGRWLLYFAYGIPRYGWSDWSRALELHVQDGLLIAVRDLEYLPDGTGR